MNANITNPKGLSLAEDVIKQLDSLKIDTDIYVNRTTELITLCYNAPHESAQLHINVLKNCEVCAKGALLLVYIEKYNNFKLAEFDKNMFLDETIRETLVDFFDSDQLNWIEAAFEGWEHLGTCFLGFLQDVVEPKERLRIIMENIINNGGVFMPYQITDIYPCLDEYCHSNCCMYGF